MPELLLDACVMINAVASGVGLQELAQHNQVHFAMARIAATEVIYLGNHDDGVPNEKIDLFQYVDRGELQIVDLAPSEIPLFVTMAQFVDDGEAATLALAARRGWALATDDRKAQNVAGTTLPNCCLVTTATLLHRWATRSDSATERIREALSLIETRAAFVPRRNDPHRDWWRKVMQDR